MIRKTFFSTFIGVLFCLTASAQEPPTFDKVVDFLPPAPNAAAITKYGEASVNKNTGTPNINIPLFSVKGNKLSTSLNLGYSSSGIKVDEVASRVGMGWAINAGGVITRTVRGVPDETNVRHYPYASIGLNWATYNYMKRISQSQNNWGYSGGFDAEPDLFNFSMDGYSGSFVFDGNGVAQVNKSGIRIERSTNIANDWNFRITTPDGVRYLFGGSTGIETTKRDQTCGRSYTVPIATSWYLKEINHPNGEKILFTYAPLTYQYESGVSQTMSTGGFNSAGTPCGVPIPVTTCINLSKTYGVLLTEIESPGKSKVIFEYMAREDCQDKLISKITLKDPVNVVGSFDLAYTTVTGNSAYNNEIGMLGYDKIPYLSSVTENSADNSLQKKHYFSYIDPGGRPSRLSFSQDHWGYFNGINGVKNTTFTPGLGASQFAVLFPLANANREPEFSATEKGLLQKIVYPTGGTTHIFYEPNVSGNVNSYTTMHRLSCEVTGTGNWNTVTKTKKFTVQTGQIAQLQIECRDNSGTGNYDPIHNKGSYMLTPVGTNGTPVVITPGFNNSIPYQLSGGEYELTFSANGTVVTTFVTLRYVPTSNSGNSPVLAGGVRVQRIATTNPGEAPMLKRYFYGNLQNLNQSSLSAVFQPSYFGSSRRINGETQCNLFTLSSSSINNLGRYNNSVIAYFSVVESIGENFEGGGTEYRFNATADGLGQVLWNKDILNAPYTNYSSFYNGKPASETVVKKMPDNTLKPIKKTVYTYKNEPAAEKSVYGYAVVERVPDYNFWPDTTCNPVYDPYPLSCYGLLTGALWGKYACDMVRYQVFSSFVHPETQVDTIWDENGENPVVTTKNSFYDNFYNYQLTSSTQTNSKGEVIKTTNKYPHDYMNTQVYEDMVNVNNINAVVNTRSEIVQTSPTPNTLLSEQQIDYGTIAANHYLPVAVKSAVKGNTLELDGTIDQYDAKGNILQFTNKAGIINSIIWGYNYQYPVAQVVGATYASVTAQLTVTMASLQAMDGSSLLTELNRIRTNLPDANVTTYTYKHLTGVAGITDANNKTNSYEYDAFNRLKHIKDQEGNFVKKNEYVYTTPDPNTGIMIYYNDAVGRTYTCNTCITNYSAYAQNYFVPAGKYYSLISLNDANAQAFADTALYGQGYVNKMSICTSTICTNCDASNCSGVNKKCVNGICETGVRVNTSTVKNKFSNDWTCTYHYRWSDSSISQDYTEVLSAPCEIYVEQ